MGCLRQIRETLGSSIQELKIIPAEIKARAKLSAPETLAHSLCWASYSLSHTYDVTCVYYITLSLLLSSGACQNPKMQNFHYAGTSLQRFSQTVLGFLTVKSIKQIPRESRSSLGICFIILTHRIPSESQSPLGICLVLPCSSRNLHTNGKSLCMWAYVKGRGRVSLRVGEKSRKK